MGKLASQFWQGLKLAGMALATGVVLFAEWGWLPLALALGFIARLPAIAWLERHIAAMRPRAALVVFCVPMLLLLPVKIGALCLIAGGRAVMGLVFLVCSKILGTALVGRLFLLTQPQLMGLPWFARGYARWRAWRARVRAWLHASPPWRAVRAFVARVRRQARRH